MSEGPAKITTASLPPAPGFEAARETADLVRHSLTLGTALDALVRSARAGEPSLGPVSSRVHELWTKVPKACLRLAPMELHFDGHVALTAGDEGGRWILPAFMSGLRSMRIRPGVSVDDVRDFGEELSSLEANVATITRFRDWLWSDGAQGFEVDLHACFVEAMDAVTPEAAAERAILEARMASAIAGWNDTLYLASRELDAAAVRDEFQVPLSLYLAEAAAGGSSLARADADRLRAGVEDAATWSNAEMDAVMAHPELRSSLPAQRLARRLVATIEAAESVDSRLLDFLTHLGGRQDAYCRAVASALENESVGAAIAAGTRLDPANLDALRSFTTTSPPAVGRGIVHGLLHRAASDAPALAAVLELARAIGVKDLLARIDPGTLGPDAAVALARTVTDSGEPPAVVRDLAMQMAPRTAVAVLAALPYLIPLMKERALALLSDAPDHSNVLLDAMIAAGRRDDLALLGQALGGGGGRRWTGKPLAAALGALVSAGLGDEVLVPIVRARNADLQIRLRALEALRADPASLAEAVRWRSSEILEPPVLRRRLQDERQRLKDGRS